MELAALQQLFYDAIFDKEGTNEKELCKLITTANNLTANEGIAIYRGSILGKLSRALKSIYPVCYRLVGEKFFEATATTYIHRFPSKSPDLGDYGEHFPDFLVNFEPAASLPYLPDVTRLEWHWHRIFNGEDSSTLDLKALGKISQTQWGDLIFHLPKTSILLESPYPIHKIWQINQSDYEGEEYVNLEEGEIKVFLWRQGYDMRIDLPTEEEWQLLKAFQAKKPFETICEDLAVGYEPAHGVSALLTQFVQRGWIVDFSV
ncbi:putative DNA-binding domain-containing protein [Candidatus Parabeggiatoa sp. HSG14]|uniref:HvfC/BufC N-terminal domain-containing protein n=1 Tax=Candidatus Parabeggiatoa sp. HSG14 TaxID=3055593 RepID=UPI0025A7865D|nr:putative DNA-binding domain-containing protein [Thiotrichales bacterium HSG14]